MIIRNKINSKLIKKITKTKIEINRNSALNSKSIGYITSILACASIPHSNIKESYFKRSNGKTSLKIIADPKYGLPYGLIPRVFMIWICTEAKLTKSPELFLGKNQNEFIKKLGMKPTGGINGTITRVKEQIIRLINSNIFFIYNQNITINLKIVDDGVFCWKKKQGKKLFYWKNKITLSKNFYNEIKKSSLPIDLRVIRSMRSPLSIDIYIWLTWRIRIISKREIIISWEKLKLQFGSNYQRSYKGLLNFKKEFIKKLNIVCLFYPQACVEILKSGLKLKQSPPHIPYLFKSY